MQRYQNSYPNRPNTPSPAAELGGRLWRWLGPQLGTLGRAAVARVVRFCEGEEARTILGSAFQRVRDAVRWAWKNDTVPSGRVRQAMDQYEERLAAAERRQAQRELRRTQQDEKRKAREQRYAEKSSIYLG